LAAADALCDIDDPRATEALLAVRNHPFPEVRDAVARKLNKTQTGDPQGAAVETEPETEPEEPSEPSVPYLIAELGEDATVPRLEAIFREHEAFGLAVVEALVAVRTAEAIAALRNLGRTSHVETSAAATLALIDLGVPDAFDLLLELSRSGNHEAKRRLLGMTGEAVEQELTRSLAEDAPPPDVSIWGDLYCADYETGYVPGWFTAVSERLGDAALPILVSRVERTLPSRLDTGAQPGEGDCAAAVAAAHLLRERGVVEAIPLLQEMSATHATTEGREVATWSLVSLRRKAAGASGPLFPAD